MTQKAFALSCIRSLGAQYELRAHSVSHTDCSGILRRVFRIPYDSREFARFLFTRPGSVLRPSCYFLHDSNGRVFHVMPEIWRGIVLDTRSGVCELVQFDEEEENWYYRGLK